MHTVRLDTLQPGARFRLGENTGTLLDVNPCRARVKIDRLESHTIQPTVYDCLQCEARAMSTKAAERHRKATRPRHLLEAVKGAPVTFTTPGYQDSWASGTEVEVLS